MSSNDNIDFFNINPNDLENSSQESIEDTIIETVVDPVLEQNTTVRETKEVRKEVIIKRFSEFLKEKKINFIFFKELFIAHTPAKSFFNINDPLHFFNDSPYFHNRGWSDVSETDKEWEEILKNEFLIVQEKKTKDTDPRKVETPWEL